VYVSDIPIRISEFLIFLEIKKLLADISAGKIDTVIVYKVDRLTRSLSDFARIVDSFDGRVAESRQLGLETFSSSFDFC
jgi:DNA invertase Pin-like site-specific DNA recombinase